MSYLQRKNNELDDDMLTLTAELLSNIPEFSTLWNIRRELIEELAASRLPDCQITLQKNCGHCVFVWFSYYIF